MATLFFSYSHKDEGLRDELEKHLTMLKRQGFIETFHDRKIIAGQDLGMEIDSNLVSADVVLLLVSADFLASEYCYSIEMSKAMERQAKGEATVIPVILRACDWSDAPFGKLLATPTDAKPVTKWADRDDAFLDIAQAIKRALPQQEGEVKNITSKADDGVIEKSIPRSSNLSLAKHFTDKDKDDFLHGGFGYFQKFFENSIDELSKRNSGITGQVRPIDANRFTASVYRNGEMASECTIFINDGHYASGGIAYLGRKATTSHELNESLSVEADDQKLFFQAMGMGFTGLDAKNAKLSFEGAADYYWERFIEPLQRKDSW